MSDPKRAWLLGASDPEMEAIERLLRDAGEEVIYARGPDGQRVHPGTAYSAVLPSLSPGCRLYLVECSGPQQPDGVDVVVIDHHRPGDPGHGRPPEEFLPASSIGQVIAELARLGVLPPQERPNYGGISSSIRDDGWDRGLPDWPVRWQRGQTCTATPAGEWVLRGYRGRWSLTESVGVPGHARSVYVPPDLVLAAAADHCLAAAYRGECPGVDPDSLMRWRVETRAAFQGRPVEAVLADIDRARQALRQATTIFLNPESACDRHRLVTPGVDATWREEECDPGNPCVLPETARDMRGQHVPELPEASAREGVCVIADGLPDPDGRVKVVCQSGTPEQIWAFMEVWAPAIGLVDIYGDPARGFAGGYMVAAGSAALTREGQHER